MARADGTVVQTNHYYPYGTPFAESYASDVQDRKYIGKEYDTDNGLDWYDVEARMMDGLRFTTMDPLAEKYYSINPYAYCAGNPIKHVDPIGMILIRRTRRKNKETNGAGPVFSKNTARSTRKNTCLRERRDKLALQAATSHTYTPRVARSSLCVGLG
ncbi:MAG: hypothetical protein LBN29_05370 [Mediterranea sp.]|nr:hypothetical protein [Mediterranea sp.]